MKKIVLGLVLASMVSAPVFSAAFLYSDTAEPAMLAQQQVRPCKVGKSSCINYMGLIQLGDCSYEAAMRNGRMTQVNHHDTYTRGWFFYKHITTRVYGE